MRMNFFGDWDVMPMNLRKKLIFQNHLVQSSGISELTQVILCVLLLLSWGFQWRI